MTLLITIVALYQATLLNYVYFKKVLAVLPIDNIEHFLFFLTMPIVIFFAVFALLNAFYFTYLIKIISVLLLMLGAFLTYFMNKFNILIDRDMLENALQTTMTESLSYASWHCFFSLLFIGILPSALILFIPIKKERFMPYFIKRMIGIFSPFVGAWIISLFFFKQYAPFMRNNENIIKYLLPSNYISAVISEIKYQKYNNQPWESIGLDVRKQDHLTSEKPMLLVMLLGETARSANFSLYGYDKKTNPLLEEQSNLFVFKNTSSCGTATAYSVPCLFSQFTAKEYEARKALKQDNILDLLNRANVNVDWYENDGGCKGVCDRINNKDLTEIYVKNKSVFCESGVCKDEILTSALKKALVDIENDKLKTDHFIVLHMMGSHGPTYYKRYPKKFDSFKPTCETNNIDTCSQESLYNTYDNTILYTDYLISDVIHQLESLQSEYNVGMIYVSDHGESLGENGVYLHGLPYSIAPKEQKEIPFILWLSDSYKKALQLNAQCLTANAATLPYSHDDIFHTLLGLFFMKTELYNDKLDVIQACKN